jgi:hypothetical protein
MVRFLLFGDASRAEEESMKHIEELAEGLTGPRPQLSRRAFTVAGVIGAVGAVLSGREAHAATTAYLPIPDFKTIERAALVAYGQLKINDRARILTLKGGYAAVLNLGTGETNLGVDSRTGTVLSKGAVRLRDRARVEGFVQSAASVTVDTPSQSPIASGKIPNLAFEIGRNNWAVSLPTPGSNLTGNSGAVLSPLPGSFGSVVVNSGATLTLKSGRYFMTSLSLQTGSELRLDKRSGPIQVYVANSLTYRARMTDLGGEVGDFLIAVLGTTEVPLEQAFIGSLYVPNAKLTLATIAGSYVGQFLGKNVEVHQNNRVYAKPVDWRRITTPVACGAIETLGGVP